jgi:hypothetical protein
MTPRNRALIALSVALVLSGFPGVTPAASASSRIQASGARNAGSQADRSTLTNDRLAGSSDPAMGPGGVVVHGGRYGALSVHVTFESLNLAPNTQINVPDGVATTVDGYTFAPGPNNNSGFNDSHFGNAVDFWPFNGTTVMVNHDDVIMTKAGGGSFSLASFDLAGWPVGFEVPFTVTGQPGNVTQVFTPDGLVDGPGGVADFQTFVLPATFQNVTSVTWEHTGAATIGGIFALDNIVTDVPTSAASRTWSRVKRLFR